MTKPFVIALDGPAAAGKGTLAKRLAAHYNLAYLDTGSLYRAVGLAVLRAGGDPTDPAAATEAAKTLGHDLLSDPELRSAKAGDASSKVAAIPGVRAALFDWQRRFAAEPQPDVDGKKRSGSVLDGRDIGTVICPEAEVKIFVTASAEARANRRLKELQARGEEAIYARVLEDIRARDARDAARADAPMKAAEDAVHLDTSDLDIDQVFAKAKAIVEERLKR
ncbi:(d)CMP kinase [Dongia sp.]|uniref:(d)CMP kinase n=1 Tax=Dongia sp. TaxID=1977262 RepID=UPI0035B1639D